MDDIYYKPKKKRFKKHIIFFLIFVFAFYFLNFFNINPPYMMKIINSGKINNAYSKDYIFSITANDYADLPKMEIIINESTNLVLNERLQNVDLLLNDKSFQWRKFYKFDTLITKTPYDSRNIRFEDFSKRNYYNNLDKTKSTLLNFALEHIVTENTNLLFSTHNFNSKKIKIKPYEESFNDKFKIVYDIDFNKDISTRIFETTFSEVWKSDKLKSFFVEDNDIQKKLKIENNTKHILDILNTIKENSEVKEMNMSVILNKDVPETIVLNFKLQYDFNGSSSDVNISISEHIKYLPEDYSPEGDMDVFAYTDFDKL